LTLGWNFFVPSMAYKKYQIESILFLLTKGFTYHDVLILPVHERNSIINYFMEKND
jgi:hypothetical protein